MKLARGNPPRIESLTLSLRLDRPAYLPQDTFHTGTWTGSAEVGRVSLPAPAVSGDGRIPTTNVRTAWLDAIRPIERPVT